MLPIARQVLRMEIEKTARLQSNRSFGNIALHSMWDGALGIIIVQVHYSTHSFRYARDFL